MQKHWRKTPQTERCRCLRQAKVCVFELHLLPPPIPQTISTKWPWRNDLHRPVGAPRGPELPHLFPHRPRMLLFDSEGFVFAPADGVPHESDANNAQFWWIVKMVLTLFFFFIKPSKPTDGVWCEGKPMLYYILQLSFIYTIRGHVNVLYNHEFKGKTRKKKKRKV